MCLVNRPRRNGDPTRASMQAIAYRTKRLTKQAATKVTSASETNDALWVIEGVFHLCGPIFLYLIAAGVRLSLPTVGTKPPTNNNARFVGCFYVHRVILFIFPSPDFQSVHPFSCFFFSPASFLASRRPSYHTRRAWEPPVASKTGPPLFRATPPQGAFKLGLYEVFKGLFPKLKSFDEISGGRIHILNANLHFPIFPFLTFP